jgi:predicted RNase H-like nuclease (RuvC/YqgF family)
VIVGFDPGTVAALAAVDLDGDVVFIRTFRGGLDRAVEILRERGRPSVVASDKSRNESVRRLAAAFGAVAHFPAEDLPVGEKRRLIRGTAAGNRHEKDALAAALWSYRQHSGLIARIDSRRQEIFDKLVRGELANISRALEPRRPGARPRRKRDFGMEGRVGDLERRLRASREVRRSLERELGLVRARLRSKERPRKVAEPPRTLAAEREARQRLERELLEAHGRLSRIEAELGRLRGEKEPGRKEDIRQRILRMLREYRRRFRK